MTMAHTPPPGWYRNPHGHMQWWDGQRWGQLAPPQPPVAVVRTAKDTGIAYLLAILLGAFAAHRFYLGSIAGAIVWMILWWGGWLFAPIGIGLIPVAAAGLWWFIDLFLIPGMVRDANHR